MPKTCNECGTMTLTDSLPNVRIEIDDNGNHDAEWEGTMCLSCVLDKFDMVYDQQEKTA